MQALRRGWIVALGLAAVLVLLGCGGGGAGSANPEPGAATVGPGGGVVDGADGARVSIPPEAFAEPVTVRITKDSTGAPALPEALVAAGPVYAITPHGGDFRRHVEVTIPLPPTPPADNEQQVLVTAEPGDTRWRVLSGAQPVGGALRVPVMQFSYFQIVTLRDLRAPTLVLVMDRVAGVPVPGTTQISADYEFAYRDDSWDVPGFNTEARLTHAPPALQRRGATAPAPSYCQPAVLGPAGVRLTVSRDGSAIAPSLGHYPTQAAAASLWPRNRVEAAPEGFIDTALAWTWTLRSGAGVAHFWGQDQPRAGTWVNLGNNSAAPAEPDRYTLPPAGNAILDDEWIWYGRFDLNAAHNGRLRIDATVATDCGFDVAAVPLAFRLNVTRSASAFFRLVEPSGSRDWYNFTETPVDVTVRAGEDVELAFHNLHPDNVWDLPEVNQEYLKEVVSLSWETSSDGRNWRGAPELAPSVTVDTRYRDPDPFIEGSAYRDHAVLRIWRMRFNGVMPGLSGWYRAYACVRLTWDDPSTAAPTRTTGPVQCGGGRAYRLNVIMEPPLVTRQPVGQTVLVGETASLAVAVQGTPSADLQWQKRTLADAFLQRPWSNIAGATATTYTTPPLTLADHPTYYRVAYSNASGGGFSDVATVGVAAQLAPPTISAQPGSLNVTVGGTAAFAVTADGAAPLSYQWQRNGVAITGANAPILTLNNVTSANDGRYELVVSNRAGSVTSEPAALVVTLGTPVALPPTIAQPPTSLAVPAGSPANFAVAVTGTGPYSYLWTRADAAQPVGSEPVLAFASVQPGDAGRYRVRVTNTVGTVLSAEADLTVGPASGAPVAPAIATPPVAAAATPGAQAIFAVGATGSAPLTFQWRRNGVDIPGANAAVLVLSAVSGNDAGQYSIEVRNTAGVALSTPVPLVVIGAPTITTQPVAASVTAGATASFGVAASGETLRYQWMRNGVAIVGATAASYTTPALALADNGVAYAVIVYNGAGLLFSLPAVVTVNPAVIAPTVTLQPSDLTVNEGTPAGIEFSFGGTAPFTIQLERLGPGGWTVIAGPGPLANNAVWRSYTGNLALADSGSMYRVVASNAAGSATTRAATVTVVGNIPANALLATQVTTLANRTLAVHPNGNVYAWGTWVDPLTGGYTPNGTWARQPVRVQGLGPVRQVAIGSDFASWALAADGTVWGWGYLNSTQAFAQGPGSTVLSFLAPVPLLESANTPIDRVCQIEGTTYGVVMVRSEVVGGTCAADERRSVWYTASISGRETTSSSYAVRYSALDSGGTLLPQGRWVKEIVTSRNHGGNQSSVFAIANDGSVYAWGYLNSQGQLGLGNNSTQPATPQPAPGWQGALKIAAAGEVTLALMADGSIKGAGWNPSASLGIGPVSFAAVTTPTTLAGMAGAGDVSTASNNSGSMALVAGQLRYWGSNTQFDAAIQAAPIAIATPATPLTSVAVGGRHAVAIGPGNAVYSWGDPSYRGCALGSSTCNASTAVPMLVTVP